MFRSGLFCLFLLLWPFFTSQANPGVITDIRFEGNKVTREIILKREIVIAVGDPVDKLRIEESRQYIMDLGLFKSVTADVNEAGVVTFTVDEKRYLLVLPRFSRDKQTEKISPGFKLTWANIAGLNQRIDMTIKQEDPDNASFGDQREFSLLYSSPKILQGKYNLNFGLSYKTSPYQLMQGAVVQSTYDYKSYDMSITLQRWLKKTAPSVGWLFGAGIRYQLNDYDFLSGSDTLIDDQAVSLLMSIAYTDVRDHLYSRTGKQFGYVMEQGVEELGSDHQFLRHLFYYRRYHRLGRLHHNLNFQARLGLSDGHANNLLEPAYDIAGYGDVRASATELSGDAYVLINAEYLRPVLDKNHIRSLVFVDVGNAYAKNSELDFSGLKTAVGAGVRWKIKSFVDLDVSLEYAYNISDEDYKVYLRTSAPF